MLPVLPTRRVLDASYKPWPVSQSSRFGQVHERQVLAAKARRARGAHQRVDRQQGQVTKANDDTQQGPAAAGNVLDGLDM
jgi:hypothetical protein